MCIQLITSFNKNVISYNLTLKTLVFLEQNIFIQYFAFCVRTIGSGSRYLYKNPVLNVKVPRIQSCKKDRVRSKKHIPIVSAMVGTSRLIMANNWLNQRKSLRNFQYFPKMIILGYLGLLYPKYRPTLFCCLIF